MTQQVVEVSLINKLLGLPSQTKLESTLLHINELIIFRNNHQYCKAIITNLQQEIQKIKIHLQGQITSYIQKKVEFAREETRQRSETYLNHANVQDSIREFTKIPASLEQFMENQFQMRFQKAKVRSRHLKKTSNFNLCLKPIIEKPTTLSQIGQNHLEKALSSNQL